MASIYLQVSIAFGSTPRCLTASVDVKATCLFTYLHLDACMTRTLS